MFKETFKYYKSKCPPPTFENVIDFDDIDKDKIIVRDGHTIKKFNNFRVRGLIPVEKWRIYELKDRPGLIFIRNPFTVQGQRYWIARCLQDYPKAPHAVNLNRKYFTQEIIDDWWHSYQEAIRTDDEKEQTRLRSSMRWATLGYHHEWDSKVYSEEMRHKFPDDLAELSEYFASVLDLCVYAAQAAIVNFYPLGTTLAGHTDHSEKNLNAPLFSMSFGQSAIFLLGVRTKEVRPSAMFLKNGDVVCMSKESRLCYHAVPRIIETDMVWINDVENDNYKYNADEENEEESHICKRKRLTIDHHDDKFQENLWDSVLDSKYWQPFFDYVTECRINMNIRQVLNDGEQTLHSN